MNYTYRCKAGHRYQFEHGMTEFPNGQICACGAPSRIVVRPPQIRIRYGMRGDMRDYREDLARFPNDPEAYVDGPTALAKLKDKRLREGWTFSPISQAKGNVVRDDPDDHKDLMRESFEEAQREVAQGLHPNDDVSPNEE